MLVWSVILGIQKGTQGPPKDSNISNLSFLF